MSELTQAIQRGDGAEVSRLLDADPSLLDSSENNVSAVLLAVYHGKPEIARMFLHRGHTPTFHEACALGETERVRSMLEKDPSLLDSRSPDGYPPVGLAIFFRHPQLARFLIERGADVRAAADNPQRIAPVHAAAAIGDHDIMRRLLERGADPNARQQMDYTPLHTAAFHGDIEMGKILVAAGADPQARTSDGSTVEDLAVKQSQLAFADWLRTVS